MGRPRLRRCARPRPPGGATADEGSILLLAIAACALGLTVVLLVSAASSLYLERDRLSALADAAALVGAESVDVDADATAPAAPAPATADSPRLHLTDAAVARTVAEFIADEPTTGLDELRIDGASAPDGRSARVVLSATWHPPFTTLLVPDGVRIDVTSTARGVLVGPGGAPPGPAGGG